METENSSYPVIDVEGVVASHEGEVAVTRGRSVVAKSAIER